MIDEDLVERMTDILERIKSWDKCYPGNINIEDAVDEAAAEITRLRKENEKLRRDVRTAVLGDSAELQDVKRENEKLREALKPFAAQADKTPWTITPGMMFAAAAAIRESVNE